MRRLRRTAIHTADFPTVRRGAAVRHDPSEREVCDMWALLRRPPYCSTNRLPGRWQTDFCTRVARGRRIFVSSGLIPPDLDGQRRRIELEERPSVPSRSLVHMAHERDRPDPRPNGSVKGISGTRPPLRSSTRSPALNCSRNRARHACQSNVGHSARRVGRLSPSQPHKVERPSHFQTVRLARSGRKGASASVMETVVLLRCRAGSRSHAIGGFRTLLRVRPGTRITRATWTCR